PNKGGSQPGKAHDKGLSEHGNIDCKQVIASAVADGLKEVKKDDTCDEGCWKVFLCLAPPKDDKDDHWYRQDTVGERAKSISTRNPRTWLYDGVTTETVMRRRAGESPAPRSPAGICERSGCHP